MWKKNAEKIRCSRNRDRRLAQKNMHTVGLKRFAIIREEMKNDHPNKEPPSLAEPFERTRRRNEGKTYKEPYDDTAKKIEDMKNYIPNDEESGPADAFLSVMGKDYNGRRRLYGKGVCNKKLKNVNGTGTSSFVVPEEILESLKISLFEDVRKDLDSDITKVQEMRKDMEEEYLKKKSELENMKRDIDSQTENMTEEIMRRFSGSYLLKLPRNTYYEVVVCDVWRFCLDNEH